MTTDERIAALEAENAQLISARDAEQARSAQLAAALRDFLDAWDSGALKPEYDHEGILADRMWQAVEQMRDTLTDAPTGISSAELIRQGREAAPAVFHDGRPVPWPNAPAGRWVSDEVVEAVREFARKWEDAIPADFTSAADAMLATLRAAGLLNEEKP